MAKQAGSADDILYRPQFRRCLGSFTSIGRLTGIAELMLPLHNRLDGAAPPVTIGSAQLHILTCLNTRLIWYVSTRLITTTSSTRSHFLIIKDLLKVRAGYTEDGALFWPVLREVEFRLGEREYIQIADLPGDVLRAFAGDLLFSCQVPGMGDKVLIRVPRIMIRAAVEAANRLADSLRKRKSELRIETVLSRLQREADDRKRKLYI